VGSGFNDGLFGNANANVLDGGVGADILLGAAGNDIYVVDNAGDVVSEAASQGIDEVRAAVSYALAANADVETLRTTNDNGTAAINLTGSNANNQIIGNNGDNVLDGRGGADQMAGRGGNDTYIVDNAGDTITEAGGQGSDEVRASVSFTLTAGADVELLRTNNDAGVAAINLTGNGAGNEVRGNNGANLVNGGDGNDVLTGLGGQDFFEFNTALNATTNVDTVTDFSVADDTIRLQNGVFTGLTAGTLAANQFVIGAAAQDADDRIVYDDTTGALFFDIDGAGGTAAVRFATVSAGLALTNNDFLVV
jgi:Ca2+-binding RTX toxin-like protein